MLIKTILWQLPEVKIQLLLSQLQGNLNNLSAIDLMPSLQDVAWINWLVDGQKDSKLEFERYKISSEYSSKDKLIEKFKDNYLENTMNSFENIIEPEVAPSIKTMGVKEFMQYMDFISVVKRIRINVYGNLYITFINSKNEAENIYFSVDAAKLVTEGQLIERGFFNQFKIGEFIINGNLRYKLISQLDLLIARQ